MKRLLLLLFATSFMARADIDLTPTSATRHFDGFDFPEIRFSDNGKPISYEFPRGWSYSSVGSGKIRFYPQQKAQASAEMETVAVAADFAFDEESLKALREETLHLLPKNSQQIQTISEVTNPLMINGHDTYEVTVSYVCYGQRYRLSVLYANLGKQQLRCKVSAHPQDFDQVHRLFQSSLCGLQWLTKSPAICF